jgi:hypothetical protein
LLATAVAALTLGATALPASAGIWTEVASNTTEDITAIEYQGADRFWFVTANGKIFKRVGGVFQEKQSVPGVIFRDIEFQAGGAVGFAVGTSGAVWRSANSGDTWAAVALNPGGDALDERCDLADEAVGDIDSVRFAGTARAWLVAGGSQIYRTVNGATATNVGSAAAGWQYINDNGDPCKVPRDIDDLFAVPGSDSVYFIAKSFGSVWLTTNALETGGASERAASGGNGFEQVRRLAGDPANPNRQWAVAPNGGGISYYSRTETGWGSEAPWTIANPDRRDLTAPHDVDFAGGTVLVAGTAGMILHSTDGANFYYDDADGALATQDWLSVGLASATSGAVGGRAGKLAVTSAANVLPDIAKPTGTIAGPATAIAGRPVTFTLNATDTGGSGLNAASIAWTATGASPATGNPATFTFPSADFVTVRVTFADNAGNVGEATKSVSVDRASGGGGAGASLPVSFSGPGSKLSAKIVGSRVRVRARGTISVPAGSTLRAACRGRVTLTVKKKRTTLATRKAKLKRKNGRCRFGKTIFIKRSKVGRTTTRLRLKISFKGNSALAAGQVTKTLVVRK